MAEEKRPLLLKINPAKSMYPPPEPLPTAPYPPPRNLPEKEETNFFFFDHDEQNIIEKLMLGEYKSLWEMAADINGGCKNRLVENIFINKCENY